MFSNFFENRAVYEIIWENTVDPDRPQTTMWCMGMACWIPNAIYTLSEYVLLRCSYGCMNVTYCSSWYKCV
jgi:hypothetical protein